MSSGTVALIILLLPAALVLRLAQRRLFWDIERTVRSRTLAYAIAAPSTVAHELAHAAMAVCLGVPIGARAGGSIELFRPRRRSDGSLQLGMVGVAQTDPLRSSLISIAPFILVPLMLLGLNVALLGEANPLEAASALGDLAPWRIAVWLALAITLPQAAFPSPGDHIGVAGGICLAMLAGGGSLLLYQQGGAALLGEVLAGFSALLVIPAIAAILQLALLAGPRSLAPRELLRR